MNGTATAEVSSGTVLDDRIQTFLRDHIPQGLQQHAEEMCNRLGFKGQIVISTLIVSAQEAGKWNEAMELPEETWLTHWCHLQYLEQFFQLASPSATFPPSLTFFCLLFCFKFFSEQDSEWQTVPCRVNSTGVMFCKTTPDVF